MKYNTSTALKKNQPAWRSANVVLASGDVFAYISVGLFILFCWPLKAVSKVMFTSWMILRQRNDWRLPRFLAAYVTYFVSG